MNQTEQEAAQWRHLMKMVEESDGEYAFTANRMSKLYAIRKIDLKEYARIKTGVCTD